MYKKHLFLITVEIYDLADLCLSLDDVIGSVADRLAPIFEFDFNRPDVTSEVSSSC
jgi:hypothetical protein